MCPMCPGPIMYIGRSGGRARGPPRKGGGEGAAVAAMVEEVTGAEELGTSEDFDAGSKLDF